MKYSLSNIIKDLLAKIPVLENRINTLSTKITNINNNNSVVKKVSNSAPEGNTLTLVEGAIETDAFRIIVGDEGKDNLYVSFDTCDNGNEKIQFRQYMGNAIPHYEIFNGTLIRTAVILGRNGETTFPVSVTAPKFVGSLQGNADTANKGNWKGKNDDRWYQMAFSLDSEFNWNSNNAFRYNPASNVLQVGTVQGNITGNAGSANVGKALQVFDGNNNAINSTFHWVGQNGQPAWLWGSNDGSNQFVYNPANFHVAYANNADTVDGYHASDLLRTLDGNKAPVMTDIFDRAGTIDLTALSAADKARHKALIDKSQNTIQNLWNNTTGIHAYGGDVDMANGYAHGTLKLTQSYKNFDKILVVASGDDAIWTTYRIWDTWELAHAFSSCFAFDIIGMTGIFWIVYGTQQHGTEKFAWSTDTVWSCREQNCGIIAIYGLSY